MKAIFKYGRARLIADEGKIITNGVDVYGYDITFAVGEDTSAYHEITVGEYEEIMRVEEAKHREA